MTSYVLIDFENVKPTNLEILKQHPFKVLVFVGINQAKVPFDLAQAMQALGTSAQYIKIAGSGKNALDFHVAYYIGELAAKEPGAGFHVVSRDKGFEPLIKHLKGKNIKVDRVSDLAEIPALRISTATSDDKKIDAIVRNLKGRGQSRPRKVKTLANTINSLFKENLTEQQLKELIKELEQKNYIKVKDGNITYRKNR